MLRRNFLFSGAALLATPALVHAAPNQISAIQVLKSQRRLDVLSGSRVLKSYDVQLGRVPVGPKRFEGDNRTPEGRYRISARVPQSSFHKSLRISYPNPEDMRYASRYGKPAGGDICVHGQPNGVSRRLKGDWTAGCVALSNRDMSELYGLIPIGVPIRIYE